MADALAGIDIGNGNLKLALYRDESDIRLASCRLPENMMRKGSASFPQTMAAFIKQMKHEHDIACADAALVLPATATYFRQVTLPAMSIEELEINLPYEFRDFITEPSDAYYYDYMVHGTEVDDEGKPVSLDLYAAAVLKSTIAEYGEMLRRGGFRLKVALPHEAVYARLLALHIERHPEEADREVAFIDIGYDVTTITIFEGISYLASKTIEIGCKNIDAAIAEAMNIDEYTASTYKLSDFEGVLSLPACVDIYNDFAVEVNKMVNFFNYNNPGKSLSAFYYLGGGANIAPLTQAIGEFTQIASRDVTFLLPPAASGRAEAAACVFALTMSMCG